MPSSSEESAALPDVGGAGIATRPEPSVIVPLRASDVHDSRVRRIDPNTPDIVCPKPKTRDVRPCTCRSRIKRQYPHRDSAVKSPDREREPPLRKNAPSKQAGRIFMKPVRVLSDRSSRSLHCRDQSWKALW